MKRTARRRRNKRRSVQVLRKALSFVEGNLDSPDEGEEFICMMCDAEDKPCVENPAIDCPEKILGGTHLESARNRVRFIGNREPQTCASCGIVLPPGLLKRSPMSDVCPTCRGGIRRAPLQ